MLLNINWDDCSVGEPPMTTVLDNILQDARFSEYIGVSDNEVLMWHQDWARIKDEVRRPISVKVYKNIDYHQDGQAAALEVHDDN